MKIFARHLLHMGEIKFSPHIVLDPMLCFPPPRFLSSWYLGCCENMENDLSMDKICSLEMLYPNMGMGTGWKVLRDRGLLFHFFMRLPRGCRSSREGVMCVCVWRPDVARSHNVLGWLPSIARTLPLRWNPDPITTLSLCLP